MERLELLQEPGRDQAGAHLRGISHCTASCSEYKAGRIRRSAGHLEWWHLSAQVTIKCGGTMLFWGLRQVEHLPAHWQQQINSLLCFACVWGVYLLSCLYFSPWDFSLLLFKSPSSPAGGAQVSGCVVCHCQLELNHIMDNSSFELLTTAPSAIKATLVKKFCSK